MSVCGICQKDFKQKWRLERHKNKKRPCEKGDQNTMSENQNTMSKNQNTMSKNQNTMSKDQNTMSKDQNTMFQENKVEQRTKCQFCDKECKNHVKRHESSCPYGKDEVRLLEVELGIPFKNAEKFTCKFCNKRYSRIDVLTQHDMICDKKRIYLATLEGRKIARDTGKPVQVNVYNIRNDNRSINTLNDNRISNDNRSINTIQNNEPILRKFGEENISYINKGTIFNAMKKGLDQGFNRILHEVHCNENHPENHNLRLTNIRSAVMDVFNGTEFEKQPVDQVIATVLKKTTDLMFEHYFDDERYYDSNAFVRRSFNQLDALDNNDPKDMKPYKQKVKCKLYNNSNKMKL